MNRNNTYKKWTIKMLCMDIDGTLTDGKIHMSERGELFKSFDIKDGYAIAHILPSNKIVPVIITGRHSEIVKKRAQELHIEEIHQGINDKLEILETVAKKYNYNLSEIAYIGDDLIDFSCMEVCGLSGCPADSVEKIKGIADYICKKKGGHGAVREFIEWLTESEKVDE